MCLIIQCECCSLDWVFAHDAFILHVTCSCITMHCSFFFYLFPKHIFCCVSFLFLSFLSFWLWHPKSLFLPRTRSLVVVLLLLLLLFPLFLVEIGSMIQNPKRILRRTLMTGWFTCNAMSFYLIFQTLLYPKHLALGVANLFVRNPRGVPACLYRSSTPTYMLLIPLFLSLLRYSEEHVS